MDMIRLLLGKSFHLFSRLGNDLLIGLFETLKILIDLYTDFAKGTTGVRVLQSIDISVRHAESFAAMQGAIA